MKIITRLTDEQLKELYENYNFENILDEYPDDYPYYIIPKVLSLGNIELSEYNACFTDKDGYVYSRSYAAKHLMQFTGLTIQELFDLTVLHINDTNDRPVCSHPDCNCKLKWSGRLTAGYGSGGHRWDESPYHFCSRECAVDFQYKYRDAYPEMKKFLESGGTFGQMMEDEDAWTDQLIRSRYTNFMNQGDPNDICWFYVTWTNDNKFKFGVTSDIKTRRSYSNFITGYKNPHIINEGTRTSMATLEMKVKYKLKTASEYLEPSRVKEFWKAYKELI